MRHAENRAQQQRVYKLLAKLAVANPELTVLIATKRQAVDKNRIGSVELHVVGACVGQRDVFPQRPELHVEVQ